MDNGDYFLKHSEELSRKYPGKYVAIVSNRLIAIGSSNKEVFMKAKQKFPGKIISISYIPRRDELVTLL
jgi:hypothetical protein